MSIRVRGRWKLAWIRQIPYEESTGLLRRIYDEALGRAGRIWKIVKVGSLRPRTLQAAMQFYQESMHGPSDLTRVQREMLATVVSAELACPY
ncbi:MAG: hypothetical protein OXH72_15705 [Caldilineaceae bacterium]|nr:hypothetical protein [Caldilineaceae bacterium]